MISFGKQKFLSIIQANLSFYNSTLYCLEIFPKYPRNFFKLPYLLQYYQHYFFFFLLLFLYILLIMLLQLSHFPSFIPLLPTYPLPPTLPPFSSCPWVIRISSLASTFPILFLTSPCLCSTYHVCYLFSVPFLPLPLPLPC